MKSVAALIIVAMVAGSPHKYKDHVIKPVIKKEVKISMVKHGMGYRFLP